MGKGHNIAHDLSWMETIIEKEENIMKKILTLFALFTAFCVINLAGYAADDGMSGESLFNKYCQICHPDGGNIVKPDYGLHKKDLEAHKITKPADIVEKMRNPGPGMSVFDRKTISDQDAEKIADYILKTFK